MAWRQGQSYAEDLRARVLAAINGGMAARLSQVNKVYHVHTIARVATMLGEDEDWLWDVAVEMDVSLR